MLYSIVVYNNVILSDHTCVFALSVHFFTEAENNHAYIYILSPPFSRDDRIIFSRSHDNETLLINSRSRENKTIRGGFSYGQYGQLPRAAFVEGRHECSKKINKITNYILNIYIFLFAFMSSGFCIANLQSSQ